MTECPNIIRILILSNDELFSQATNKMLCERIDNNNISLDHIKINQPIENFEYDIFIIDNTNIKEEFLTKYIKKIKSHNTNNKVIIAGKISSRTLKKVSKLGVDGSIDKEDKNIVKIIDNVKEVFEENLRIAKLQENIKKLELETQKAYSIMQSLL